MTALPHTHVLLRKGTWSGSAKTVTLSYDDRFMRRKVLTTSCGQDFLVDLAHTESLNHGDAFDLGDDTLVEVIAAEEPLLMITGTHLPRIAWHVGNRHTPCQIDASRLLIQRDHVIADMLRRIGATVAEVVEPFTPEGGAYGHGRTHGHDHTHSHGPEDAAADHSHSHSTGQSTGHSHEHSHGHDH